MIPTNAQLADQRLPEPASGALARALHALSSDALQYLALRSLTV